MTRSTTSYCLESVEALRSGYVRHPRLDVLQARQVIRGSDSRELGRRLKARGPRGRFCTARERVQPLQGGGSALL